VLSDPAAIVEQVQRLVREGVVRSVAGSDLALQPDTLCVHGDNAAAIAVLQQIRRVLDHA
jgi:UPF0271 protein